MWFTAANKSDPTKRYPTFDLSALAFAVLAIGSFWGILRVQVLHLFLPFSTVNTRAVNQSLEGVVLKIMRMQAASDAT